MNVAEKKSSGAVANGVSNSSHIEASEVQSVLRKHMLVDGFDMTLDMHKSQGSYLYDAKHGKRYLDFFTFIASNPLGMNHPKINNDDFKKKLGEVAVSKPSLSDIYLQDQAEFVDTFFKLAVPSYFKYSFFIEGGALAVENALKVAFDWKVKKNFAKGITEEKGHKIIHFKEAFHGRSGYTMSLTNTSPEKTALYPKFEWPRITNPYLTYPLTAESLAQTVENEKIAIAEIHDALRKNKDDIAAIILEPIQGEGGDHHFRKEFFEELRKICDENEMLFILDEVQTGIALTGKWWAHQHYVQPDIITFGKKMQVCGLLCTDRVDDVPNNVFHEPSRINSTWGGNITDMVRSKRILEIIHEDDLVKNSEVMGDYMLSKIQELYENYYGLVLSPRGKGLMCAFSCKDTETRNAVVKKTLEAGVMVLPCGRRTIRFRPPVNINQSEINEGFDALNKALKSF